MRDILENSSRDEPAIQTPACGSSNDSSMKRSADEPGSIEALSLAFRAPSESSEELEPKASPIGNLLARG